MGWVQFVAMFLIQLDLLTQDIESVFYMFCCNAYDSAYKLLHLVDFILKSS